MNDENDIHKKLDMIFKYQRHTLKVCQTVADYISNNSMGVEKRFDGMEKCFDDMKDEIKKLDKLSELNSHIYTDEEIYKLKKCLSWNALHRKTNIPLSTLQYRYKRYLKNQPIDNKED